MDIAIVKCITNERMEEIKKETYGKQTINNNQTNKRKSNWKKHVTTFLSTFV